VVAELIEGLIESSGLDWTYLRSGMMTENALRWWRRRFVPATCAVAVPFRSGRAD